MDKSQRNTIVDYAGPLKTTRITLVAFEKDSLEVNKRQIKV